MRSTLATLLGLSIVAFVSALPYGRHGYGFISKECSKCSLSSTKLSLPPSQTNLTIASDAGTLKYVALGYGVQNYTCGTAGTFTSAGAVAKLYDISCLTKKPIFSQLTTLAHDLPQTVAQFLEKELDGTPLFLGDHYFVSNPAPATGISPKFDFTSASKKGDPTAYVIAKKLGGVPAPTGTSDVDYLELQATSGSLAKYVFRVSTKGGQPPASCKPNDTLSVPYAAQYWFYG